jgi:D-aminopeptidase
MPDMPTPTSQANGPPERLAAVDALFAPYNRADAPGCVVGIALAGQVVYRKAFGLASVRHGVANTPRTRMRIGSTSKHFTCLAALMLAEENRLELDAPVNQLLPDLALPTLQGQPTLRQFMNHTSGWRCALDLSMLGNGMALMPAGWMPSAVARQQGVNFAPGRGQVYSNSGYHLLSMAIDRAAGIPLEAFLAEHVFRPLGMDDTEGVPSDTRVTRDMVSNHVPDAGGGWRHAQCHTEEIRGEGNLVSTVDDMLRWMAHLRGPKRVGSEAAWQQMLEPTVLADGTRSAYGLGLVRRPYRGLEVIEHAGGVAGGNSQMLTVPAHALDIALMSNGLPVAMRDLAPRIIDILLADHLGPEPARPDLARFHHLVGARYHGRSGRTIAFGAAGNHLGLSFMDNPPFMPLRDEGEHLRLRFEDTATCDLRLRTAELAALVGGEPPATIELRDTGYIETLVRLPATAPAPEVAGATLLGHWICHDLQATAEIALEGDALVLWLRGDYSARRRLSLTPISDAVFGVADLGLPMPGHWVLTLDDVGGRHATRLSLNGPRTRHLSFERSANAANATP